MIILEKIINKNNEVYAQLSYEPLKNYLLMKWVGKCSDEEIKSASLLMLDWQVKFGWRKKCHFHVHNTKELEVAWINLIDWINNELFSEAYNFGLRYNVSILSPDLFSKLSSFELHKSGNKKVPTVLFDSISSAEKWIRTKNIELR
ncbi:MAG: hypothetical protein RIB54_13020 [Fulvivirga sp.]|uniref:hypothetical protein n=1 Tax=Fulvivirga sp. TaxID=1931237 RepID=UPI0032EDD555